MLTQRLTFTHFTGKHLLHCKSSMHIRLFLCPEHTNAVSHSEKKTPFFSSLSSVWGVQVGKLPGSLKHLSYRNVIHFCALNQLTHHHNVNVEYTISERGSTRKEVKIQKSGLEAYNNLLLQMNVLLAFITW